MTAMKTTHKLTVTGITEAGLLEDLMNRIERAGNQARIAEQTGVPDTYLTRARTEGRWPERLFSAMGYERVVVYRKVKS